MIPKNKETLLASFAPLAAEAKRRAERRTAGNRPLVTIGMATCGLAAGAAETREAFEESLSRSRIDASVIPVGCLGHCYAEPLVGIRKPGFPLIYYHHVTPGKAKALVQSFLAGDDPLFEYILGAAEENDLIPAVADFPRFSMEKRIVLEKCGVVDPEDLYHYIEEGGYSALLKALSMAPADVVREVREAGVRGKGGAGFCTGDKWALAGGLVVRDKVVICNADEGDPGAYMDRTIMESNPQQLIEGMAICAYGVGANRAVVYVRSEYPLAVERISRAVAQARDAGLLGKNVLGTGFDLEVSVFQGSGAFVCGEETALIRSIEGRRGMPRHRPPYPTAEGLWGLPTVINNVKTLATIPPVLKNGGNWHRGIGASRSPGTAVFSVVGHVVHPGLVEVPLGVSLRTLIFDVCGGVPKPKRFKAVQIGGPSGGCLPESRLDTPVDFDSLLRSGAMMGSGGLVVMDDRSCMVNVARYFLNFTRQESCGKCTPCRIGTLHLLKVMDRIIAGEGGEQDLQLLESLSGAIKEGSLCGLGKTAPNPVLTSLEYYRDEYEAHIREKRCPAAMCRKLTAFYIDPDRCARGCDVCAGCCPVDAIFTAKGRKKAVDQALCVKCGECEAACPAEYDAVRRVSPAHLAPVVERPKE
ncbi:MAG: NADH-ubiquinone oxidoreductase-F iron-sulfur binding region domain-containing protein [Syntrophobacteraceae bacterium]